MPYDPGRVSESPEMSDEAIDRWTAGGWGVFIQNRHGAWKSYYLDGENGIIRDTAVAREMYDRAVQDPSVKAARLIRITLVGRLDRDHQTAER